MPNTAYTERLTPYIHELPTGTKNELLLQLALLVFTEGTGETPASLSAFYQAVRKLIAPFHPDEHAQFDRSALTRALGDYLVEWWGESLDRTLTGRDLDQLLDELPDSGIRENLKRLATDLASRKAKDR